mgnify:CR=1 FL=1
MKNRIKKLDQNLRKSRQDFSDLEIELLRYKTSQFIHQEKIKELEERNDYLRAAVDSTKLEAKAKYEKIIDQKSEIIDAQEQL